MRQDVHLSFKKPQRSSMFSVSRCAPTLHTGCMSTDQRPTYIGEIYWYSFTRALEKAYFSAYRVVQYGICRRHIASRHVRDSIEPPAPCCPTRSFNRSSMFLRMTVSAFEEEKRARQVEWNRGRSQLTLDNSLSPDRSITGKR